MRRTRPSSSPCSGRASWTGSSSRTRRARPRPPRPLDRVIERALEREQNPRLLGDESRLRQTETESAPARFAPPPVVGSGVHRPKVVILIRTTTQGRGSGP